MKIAAILTVVFLVAVTISNAAYNKTKKHPAFSKVLYDYSDSDESTTTPPAKSCACADKPGLYAGPFKTMSKKYKQLSLKLEDFANDLSSVGHRRSSNQGLISSTESSHLSGALEDQFADGKTDEIAKVIEGIIMYNGVLTKTVHHLSSVAAGKHGGKSLYTVFGEESVKAKLRSISNLVKVIDAIAHAVQDIAKSAQGLQTEISPDKHASLY